MSENNGKNVKIGLVGCGHRGIVGFIRSIRQIQRSENLVALCDSNPTRLDFAWNYLGSSECIRYQNLDDFLQHPGLNTVIVATPDHSHRELVLRAFEKNMDVVCEKPMATTLEDAADMLRARGDNLFRMAFNFRYHPVLAQTKAILKAGKIGRILHIDAVDVVSWQHGGDYFRRWHARSVCSGGLLVHKSTHLFDALNWCIEDRPAKVFARGAKLFYTPDRQQGENCRRCRAGDSCRFYVDLNRDVPGQEADITDFYRHVYLEAEHHDGYIRDTCVFHRNNDICDTHNVSIRYQNGVSGNYSAIFYGSYEDRRAAFQGEEGRLEFSTRDHAVTITDTAGNREVIPVPRSEGGHGGADVALMSSLFDRNSEPGAAATAEDGYWSLAVAACANQSIAEGRDIPVSDLNSETR